MDIYSKVKKMGEKEVREAVSRGEYPYLPALDYFLEQTGQLAQMPVGLTEIPLSMVVGTKTVGRSNVFSRSFKPILGPETGGYVIVALLAFALGIITTLLIRKRRAIGTIRNQGAAAGSEKTAGAETTPVSPTAKGGE